MKATKRCTHTKGNDMDLGAWTNHIALDEMLSWGYPLPPKLAVELEDYRASPEESRPLSRKAFSRLWSLTVEYAKESVSNDGYVLPAHNYERHFKPTVRYGLRLFDAQFGSEATTTYGAMRQATALGLLLHDCHHTGSALRQDHITPLHLPELGVKIAVEEVSAIAADDFLRQQGVPAPWRLFIVGLIWASTFGHAQALKRSDHEEDVFVPIAVHPKTFYHMLMRTADSQPLLSLGDTLRYATHVLLGEMPAIGHRVNDSDQFISCQQAYLEYVGNLHDELDLQAGWQISQATGMRTAADTQRQQLSTIANGEDEGGSLFIKGLLQSYPAYS